MTLLPCAHCGGEAAFRHGGVHCLACYIKTAAYYDDEAAADVWNRRTELAPTLAPVTLRDVFAAALLGNLLLNFKGSQAEAMEIAYLEADKLISLNKEMAK